MSTRESITTPRAHFNNYMFTRYIILKNSQRLDIVYDLLAHCHSDAIINRCRFNREINVGRFVAILAKVAFDLKGLVDRELARIIRDDRNNKCLLIYRW
jgi:hypothetical protein